MLTIQDHEAGSRAPWNVNVEQRAIWRACEKHDFVYALKPRQVGASTAVCLEDALWTMTCDADKHRVRCAIVVDTFDKSMERLTVCEDFLKQLGTTHRRANNVIYFPNKSEIVAWSAAADEVGRSLSVQRLHITELPFFESPASVFTSLMQGLSLSGQCVIETTADIRTPFARDLWRANNAFHKMFLPLTLHAEYRADPSSIDEAQWAEAQAIGITDREVAAWFMWARDNKCGGDMLRARREYPIRVEDCWSASSGRVVEATPPVATLDGTIEVTGMRGDAWHIEVYSDGEDAIQHSGQIVIAIDSAQGVGKTHSIVVAVDKRTRRVLACFADNTILHDDLARVAQTCAMYFKPRAASRTHHDRTQVVCEADGAGRHTAHELSFLGVPHDLFWQSKNNNAERCVVAAKRHIESNGHPAPKVLTEECDELHRDERSHLKGRKDCLMMYGIAMLTIDASPYVQPADPEAHRDRRNRMTFADSLADHDAGRSGRGLRSPWGT